MNYFGKKRNLTDNEKLFLHNVSIDLESNDSLIREMFSEIGGDGDIFFARVYSRVLKKLEH